MQIDEFREQGHRLVEQIADLLESIEERPLFGATSSAKLEALFDEPVPVQPSPLGGLIDSLEEKLLPYCTHVNHPGYFGLITPSPLPAGILADFLASALNQNVGAWSVGPSAVAMERRVVRWLGELVGWDDSAGGNLTSGGMMANFIGVKLGRDWASGDTAQISGFGGPVAAYTSEERHISVDKAVDAVGIGRQNLRILPTDARFRVDLQALEAALEADRRAGIRPLVIIAMGGSTNTGAVDDLRRLREIADRERVWLHVDAAYGGGMLLSQEHPGVLDGIETADSITIDPHKWFFAPLDAGAVLVRDASRLTRSFGLQPAYLTDPLDPKGERYNYYAHGFEQSKRFRGLKVWLGLKRHGTAEIGRWVDANVGHARRLWERAEEHPDFQPALYPPMSAVCLRYSRAGEGPEAAALHARVVRRIEEGGRFWISTTVLKGLTWFRVNPVNFRTRLEHMDALFDLLVSECEADYRRGG